MSTSALLVLTSSSYTPVLDLIFLNLPPSTLLTTSRLVCQHWNTTVSTSPLLLWHLHRRSRIPHSLRDTPAASHTQPNELFFKNLRLYLTDLKTERYDDITTFHYYKDELSLRRKDKTRWRYHNADCHNQLIVRPGMRRMKVHLEVPRNNSTPAAPSTVPRPEIIIHASRLDYGVTIDDFLKAVGRYLADETQEAGLDAFLRFFSCWSGFVVKGLEVVKVEGREGEFTLVCEKGRRECGIVD